MLVGVAILLGLAVGTGIAWAAADSSGSHSAKSAMTVSATATRPEQVVSAVATEPVRDWDTSSGGAVAGEPITSAAQAAAVLAHLDAIREHAFARRATVMLGGVYAPGPLLTQDAALLQRLVPVGCGLQNVHTTYQNLQLVGGTEGSVQVTVTATIGAAVLTCNGAATAKSAAAGPMVLRITLQPRGNSYVISAIQR